MPDAAMPDAQVQSYCTVSWQAISDIPYQPNQKADYRFLTAASSFKVSSACSLAQPIAVTSSGALTFPAKGVYTIDVALRALPYNATNDRADGSAFSAITTYLGIAPITTAVYGNATPQSGGCGMGGSYCAGSNRLASSSVNSMYTGHVSFTGIFYAGDQVNVFFWSSSDQVIKHGYGDTRVTVTLVHLLP